MTPRRDSVPVAGDEVEKAFDHLTRALLSRAAHSASMIAPGLEVPGLIIMLHVASHGPTSPAAIVQETGIDKTIVVRNLQALRVRGFITPLPDEYGPGRSLYSATRRGMKRLEEIRTQNTENYTRVLSTWSEEKVSQFVDALNEIVQESE